MMMEEKKDLINIYIEPKTIPALRFGNTLCIPLRTLFQPDTLLMICKKDTKNIHMTLNNLHYSAVPSLM